MGRGKFAGKVLLELGTSESSVDIVRYARTEGAYVIVADNLPIEKSEAKKYADKAVLLSSRAVDDLCDFAIKNKVNAVFCGVSESNLKSVYSITKRLGLPCYFTEKQWRLCQNKAEFKDLCEKNHVPVPKRYYVSELLTPNELSLIRYPVIVKPVDQGASIGVHICHNADELRMGYKDARDKSYSHQVIVEQYIIGTEFRAHYVFVNGKGKCSMIIDKYTNGEQKEFAPLPEAYVFPSKFKKEYMEKIDENIKRMFLSIGYQNGIASVQGVSDENGMYIYEAGLRMDGTAIYRFTENINGLNAMKMMVDYAVMGKLNEDLKEVDPELNGKCGCLLTMLNRGGLIHEIRGYDEASRLPGVCRAVLRYHEGDFVPNNGTLQQIHIRFFIICNSFYELNKTIHEIQKKISVRDKNGEEMLLSHFDTCKMTGNYEG